MRSTGRTDPGAPPGVLLLATFERPQQVLVERLIEILGDDETPFVDPESGAGSLNWHEARHGPSRAGDDDLLSRSGLPQQPRQMSLRLMNADLMHGVQKLD